MLKAIPRSGFGFLGAGRESVADHSFSTAFIAFVMSRMEPQRNALRLISMSLVHDLTEARIGDLNSVQKEYVTADEAKALCDTISDLPFGESLAELIDEYQANQTPEARLAHDADQLALILDLKALSDLGYQSPSKWLPPVVRRLRTETGKQLAAEILETEWDAWWLNRLLEQEIRVDRTPPDS
jgi:putative hydrolase of HD superfamily